MEENLESDNKNNNKISDNTYKTETPETILSKSENINNQKVVCPE